MKLFVIIISLAQLTLGELEGSCNEEPTIVKFDRNDYYYGLIRDQMISSMGKHGYSGYDIIKIEYVKNPCLLKRFKARREKIMNDHCCSFCQDTFLFHGSPQWRKIIREGFDEKYASPDGMFGPAIYFAEHSSKSNQYVFGISNGNRCPTHGATNCMECERVLILSRVILGNTLHLSAPKHMDHPPAGYHSVHGVPGKHLRYPEYAIYRGDQAYPGFLITYKLKP